MEPVSATPKLVLLIKEFDSANSDLGRSRAYAAYKGTSEKAQEAYLAFVSRNPPSNASTLVRRLGFQPEITAKILSKLDTWEAAVDHHSLNAVDMELEALESNLAFSIAAVANEINVLKDDPAYKVYRDIKEVVKGELAVTEEAMKIVEEAQLTPSLVARVQKWHDSIAE